MKIELFNFEGNQLRACNYEGSIWFCAPDVARTLGFKNTRDAIIKHCKPRGVAKYDTLTNGGVQELTYIDEPNLYRVVMGAKTEAADKFQDFVVEKVLPSIRKTGTFSLQKPMSQAQLILQQAQALVAMEEQILEVKEEVKEIKAKITTTPLDYFAIAGYASLVKYPIDVKEAASLGRKASQMCKDLGYQTHTMPDPRFGSVKLYPIDILKTIFSEKNLQ